MPSGEPTAGLDLSHQIRVMRLFSEFASESNGVIASVYDFGRARAWHTRLILVDKRDIVTDGPPSAVLVRNTCAATMVCKPISARPAVTCSSYRSTRGAAAPHLLRRTTAGGHSTMGQFYGIASLDEARAYLQHDVLSLRLIRSGRSEGGSLQSSLAPFVFREARQADDPLRPALSLRQKDI